MPKVREEEGVGGKKTWRTSFDGRVPSAPRKLIGAIDAGDDGEGHDTEPPPGGVPNHVHLTSERRVAGPEAHAIQQERPVDGRRRVRMVFRQVRVVLQHEHLQL
jgi:hypothetical protein